MKQFVSPFAAILACAALPHLAAAQAPISPAISTPDRVESRIGPLDFKDGVPATATADKLFDNLDFTYAFRAFMDNLQGVSIYSIAKGMRDVGVKDNEVLVFSELMDAKSLFLTANADTIYVMGALDLSKGPVVLEAPPKFPGAAAYAAPYARPACGYYPIRRVTEANEDTGRRARLRAPTYANTIITKEEPASC
jgi:hypothetical protein